MRQVIAVVSIFVLTVVLVAGPGIVFAQEATPAASPMALSPLLEEWLAAFNAGEPEQLLALYTDDAVWEEVAIGLDARGPDQIRAHLERLFTASPDINYAVTSGFVADDHAVLEWVVTGTYSADFPGLPPATGQSFSFRGASVFTLADGKISHYTEYWDAYTFLVQLGALPAPGAGGTPTA
jgi:steroid delta-isomerase-like uncharacterized protein